MGHRFLVHRTCDHVGVAVVDTSPGEVVAGVYMDTDESTTLISRGDIALGHKIALGHREFVLTSLNEST